MSENRVLSWMPRAVVFDCDGVLMSTEEYCLLSKVLVLRDHGVEPDADVIASLKGLHYSAAGDALARALGTPERSEACSTEVLAKQRELYRTRPSHALPGALELVRRTSSAMPVACATSSPQDAVEWVLAQAGILPYLVCVTSPTMGFAPKPAPDVYTAAAKSCGVDPSDILAVEDSTSGIRSAVAAGMRVLGVGPDPSSEQLALVDHWVTSLDDPELTAWADGLTAATGRKERTSLRLAMVAQNGKKEAMRAWAAKHEARLARHDLVATAGTAQILRECGLTVRALASGPVGGDLHAAHLVATGEVDLCVFFRDPTVHPAHEADVAALVRLALVHDVPLAQNESTANALLAALL